MQSRHVGVTFHATKALDLSLGGTYTQSTASFSAIEMPTPDPEVTNEIPASDYDYSTIQNYSDLSYAYTTASIGAVYTFSPRVAFTLNFDYYDLTDDEGYVYGIESGSLYIVRTGFRISP
jgi:hypothetical protein